MDGSTLKKKSKFLSLILRHKPEKIGISLDGGGWADMDELVEKSGLSREQLFEIVAKNSKQRSRIRANQGHSISVDLGLTARVPPAVLYHRTAKTSVTSIFRRGLNAGRRAQVHLSRDVETA